MRPQVGQVVNNKYRLVRVIGDGGMGSVYEARHEVLGTTVALKFLHPELSRRQGLVQRFLQEARVSAAIQSPHVVRVSDVDQTSTNQAFIVMEYLEGKTLQTLYEELYHAGQRLSYADALEYSMQMLEGVEAAHRAGVVHRDLKPDNVIIARTTKGEPLVKLLDFGIAKLKVTGELDRGLTRPGVIMGTPEYMAPEQAYSADAVDVRADIFSLGVMIFEMLAGRRPVGGDEPHQIASAYLTGQIAQLTDLAPHIPPELASVIHRAMGPKPPDRYSSVAEFRAALEPFAKGARAPLPSGASAGTPAPIGVTPSAVSSPAPAEPSPIPKTLPPTDDQPPPGVTPAGASPPGASPAPGPVATPLGGFDAPHVGAHGTSLAEPLLQGMTTNMPPLSAAATPSNSGPPSFDPSPRPGGTAIGAHAVEQAPVAGYAPQQGTYAPTPGYAAPGGYPPPGYNPMQAQQGYAPTAPMDPLSAQAQKRGKQERSGGASLLLMLLLATGVTGVVVGGIYLGQKFTHTEENGGPIATQPPPPTTVVTSDPGHTSTQTGPVVPTQTQPIPPYTPHPTTPGTIKPTPSGSSTAPQPSATTSGGSTIPNPFGSTVIPFPWGSQIPIPPFFPGGQPTTTASTPGTTKPPATSPTPRPSGSGRPRITIPIPGLTPKP